MVSDRHLKTINNSPKIEKKIRENQNSYIYAYLNGSENYRTCAADLLPKIIGTSYQQIVEINPVTNEYRYISNIELAEA